MTKISVSSRICGMKHTVKGRIEGSKIVIEIDTPCEKFREFACLEIQVQEPSDIENNLIAEMEKQINCSLECTKECALDCTKQCLLPSAAFDVCSIEKGLAETKLVKSPFIEATEFTISGFQ